MLSEALRAFFIEEFKHNLSSVSTFISKMQEQGTVMRIIFNAFSDPNSAGLEEDETVKEFIVNTRSAISLRSEIQSLAEKFRFFSKQVLELNLLLLEAKGYDVTGKSYYESQILKKLVAHQILMIRSDVFPLLIILDNLEVQYNKCILDSDDLFKKLGLESLLTFRDIRTNLRNLSEAKKVRVIEKNIGVIYEHLFNYYKMLVLKSRLLSDDIKSPIKDLIRYIITSEPSIY
jgi:hypothetical protein